MRRHRGKRHLAPVGASQKRSDHIGHEDAAHEQQDLLNPAETATHGEQPNEQAHKRHRHRLGNAEQRKAARNARELGDGDRGVSDEERHHASAVLRAPNFSRISEAKPLPVTQPQRAAVSCTTMSNSAITGSIHNVA